MHGQCSAGVPRIVGFVVNTSDGHKLIQHTCRLVTRVQSDGLIGVGSQFNEEEKTANVVK